MCVTVNHLTGNCVHIQEKKLTGEGIRFVNVKDTQWEGGLLSCPTAILIWVKELDLSCLLDFKSYWIFYSSWISFILDQLPTFLARDPVKLSNIYCICAKTKVHSSKPFYKTKTFQPFKHLITL